MYRLKVSGMQMVESTVEEMTIAKFISKLFYYQTAVKFFHLKVNGSGSYATHTALNDLYESLSDICDSLTETSQTENILELTHEKVCSCDVSKDTIMELCAFVNSNRYVFVESFQQNMVDTLVETIALTKYKLKFLS